MTASGGTIAQGSSTAGGPPVQLPTGTLADGPPPAAKTGAESVITSAMLSSVPDAHSTGR